MATRSGRTTAVNALAMDVMAIENDLRGLAHHTMQVIDRHTTK
ncbi:MAG TPA: hypothetical protein VK211_22650 [Kamptonema sp.]|nr:hypothetical protein [Kamptonema sp.]